MPQDVQHPNDPKPGEPVALWIPANGRCRECHECIPAGTQCVFIKGYGIRCLGCAGEEEGE